MDRRRAKPLLERILSEIRYANGAARTDDFAGLRQVEQKVREARMVISELPGFGSRLANEMDSDPDFDANSRRVRLEALAGYCDSALRFLDAGVMRSETKKLYKAPDVTELTKDIPQLEPIIRDRWLEAQKCVYAGAYLSAVIMMGSILEALLLARAHRDQGKAQTARAAPKRRDGHNLALHDWTLDSLINVAAEVGWLKVDRKSFSHALRRFSECCTPMASGEHQRRLRQGYVRPLLVGSQSLGSGSRELRVSQGEVYLG